MPGIRPLNIDLGDFDPYFERYATAHGQPVAAALGNVLSSFLADALCDRPAPQKRVFRAVNFASEDERNEAQKRAQAMNLPLGVALRKVAMQQVFDFSESMERAPTGMAGVPSGGVLAAVGASDASTSRVEVRLTASEMAVLEQKSKAGRYRSVQALIVAITRAFLLNAPVIDPTVAAGLGRENLELVRISNYIGQLTRDVEGGKRLGLLDAADVIAMLRRVEEHTQAIAKALVEAQGRWVMKRQEAGGHGPPSGSLGAQHSD